MSNRPVHYFRERNNMRSTADQDKLYGGGDIYGCIHGQIDQVSNASSTLYSGYQSLPDSNKGGIFRDSLELFQ